MHSGFNKRKGLEVARLKAGQQALLIYDDLAELIDLMIYTKVIEITEIESDFEILGEPHSERIRFRLVIT